MNRLWILVGTGFIISCSLTVIFPPPALACKQHEVVEYEGAVARCVAKCIPTEVYVSIPTDSSQHCLPQRNAIFNWFTIIIRFLSAGVGIAVVGGIVWGGLLYATARDNQAQTQKAITVITNSVIGLLLFILMFAIINFLVPGGLLT